jgi:hypothetical protein
MALHVALKCLKAHYYYTLQSDRFLDGNFSKKFSAGTDRKNRFLVQDLVADVAVRQGHAVRIEGDDDAHQGSQDLPVEIEKKIKKIV